MIRTEIENCLLTLRNYYPGDWPAERQALWADAFHEADYRTAMAAIRELGQTERWPTVAALVAILEPRRGGGVIHDGDRMFMPGTGWISPASDDRSLTERSDHQASVTHIEAARAVLRRTKQDRDAS